MTKEAEELLSKLDHNLNDIIFDLVDENETLEGQVNELREQVARLTERTRERGIDDRTMARTKRNHHRTTR